MATQVQFRGGSSTEHNSFTGAAREVTVDTTKNTVVIHDGSTAGGHALATENNPTFTGDLTIPDKIIHSGDTNTFIRFPAADAFSVDTAGSERLRIDSTGKVGIGVLAPLVKLDVVDSAAMSAIFRQSSGNQTSVYIKHDDSSGRIGTSYAAGGGAYKPLAFETSNTERMRIDSSGRLLLGTTTVGFNTVDNLTIADSGNCGITIRSGASSSGSIYFADGTTGSAEYEGFIDYQQAGGHLRFGTGGGQERMRIDSAGNVFIGGTSAGTADIALNANGSATFVGPVTVGSGTVYTKLYNGSMLISNAGNAGQGFGLYNTTVGDYTVKLDFDGSITTAGSASFAGGEVTINASGNAAGKFNIDSTPDGGNSAWGLSVKNNDSRAGRPTLKLQNVGGGNAVEIANSDASANTTVITTAGAATFAGTVSAQGSVLTSDQRFKENITDANAQLADVTALGNKLRNWDWTADAPVADKDTRFLGLVAQEAETICPGIVTTIARTKDGDELTPEATDEEGNVTPATYEQLDDSYKGIKNDILIMKLLGAVAELSAKVAALEAG